MNDTELEENIDALIEEIPDFCETNADYLKALKLMKKKIDETIENFSTKIDQLDEEEF
jgi:phage host-nuclease inhibitor protein Gam